MYQTVKCGYCQQVLGSYHGYSHRNVIRSHFKLAHPEEFKKIMALIEELKELKKLYHFPVGVL